MSIKKFRASRVNNTTVSSYVGQPGDIFYDEVSGKLKISDGHTVGGHYIDVVVATHTQLGGIKAGPGANVSVDGTLTIDTTGIPLSIGDLYIAQANISAVNANEDLNLLTNGTGDINIVGNLHVHTTSQGPDYPTPILSALNDGNVIVNGNLITNGGTYLVGITTFVGPTIHSGNLVTNGNLITNGSTYLNGPVVEIGNVTVTGNAVNNGRSIFNGDTVFNGNTIRNGATVSTGNVTWNGTTTTNGTAINNGPTTFNGNMTITGNTTQVGNLTITGVTINNGLSVFNGNLAIAGEANLIGNTRVTGNTLVTGNTTVTGTTTVTGNTTVTGSAFLTGNTTVTGNTLVTGTTTVAGNTLVTGNTQVVGTTYLTGNSYVTGNTFVTGTTTVTGNTYVTGAVTTITGSTYLQGNSYVTGNTFVVGPTTVTGNITVTGNSVQTGLSTFVVSQQNSTIGAVEITGDTNGLWQTPITSGVMLQVTGQASTPSRIYNDAMNNYALYVGRRFNGTMASPTAVLANDDISRFAGGVYTSAGWANIGPSRISFVSSENQTGTNQGGRIELWTTANSAGPAYANIQRIATVDAAVGVQATQFTTAGNVTAGNINVSASGTLSTPRVILNDGGVRQLTGNTAVTLDFTTDSMVSLTNPTNAVTITLANYTAGAIIRFIYSSATARTINLGVAAAVNSTTGGTTLLSTGPGAPIGNNQSVILTYYCVGGTAATTYVSASYV